MFFGGGCNIGAKTARGKFLLFLNNDVFITPGSVDRLIALYKSSFSPGAVGPKFLYPNGVLQEAGAFVLPNGWTFQQGKARAQPDRHFAHGIHIVDYCSAACLLVERQIFKKYRGFDPIFQPAYFEDVDLCLRLRKDGLYTYYDSDVIVYHEEHTTSVALWSREKITAINVANHQKFLERWSTYLESRSQNAGQPSQHASAAADVPFSDSEPAGSVSAAKCYRSGPIGVLRRHAAMCGGAGQQIRNNPWPRRKSATAPEWMPCAAGSDGVLNKYRMVEIADVDSSLYDHTISFPDSAFGEGKALSNLNCLRMLFDTL